MGWLYELRAAQVRDDPPFAAWCLRDVVRRDTGERIGHAGFHDRPKDGTVEFGYTIEAPWRRQGYATEAAEGLIAFARSSGARAFLLSIAPDNAPSLAIAAKLGFEKVGEQIDERDGLEWVFRLG